MSKAMDLNLIPTKQIQLLSSILLRLPAETQQDQYTARITRIAESLESTLRRPRGISRLFRPPQSLYTFLCGVHKPLNAAVVHTLFKLISLEVGVRLNALVVAGRDRVGSETWDCQVLNLRSLHGIWLPPDCFHKTFGLSLRVSEGSNDDDHNEEQSGYDYAGKWKYQQDRCEACMISRIVSDVDTLLDLRMVVKSRTRTKNVEHHNVPRLNVFIDSWLAAFKAFYQVNGLCDEVERQMELNNLKVDRLKRIRKDIVKEKRKRGEIRVGGRHHSRQKQVDTGIDHGHGYGSVYPSLGKQTKPNHTDTNTKPTTLEMLDHDHDVEVQQAHDAELDIISDYAALISTPYLPGMGIDEHKYKSEILTATAVASLDAAVASAISAEQDSGYDSTSDDPLKPGAFYRATVEDYAESVYSQVTLVPVKECKRYVHPRAGWKSPEITGKSVDLYNHSYGNPWDEDDSWEDVSVPPSQFSLPLRSKTPGHDRARNVKVSPPIHEDEPYRTSYRSPYQDEQPVSPVSIRRSPDLDNDVPISPMSLRYSFDTSRNKTAAPATHPSMIPSPHAQTSIRRSTSTHRTFQSANSRPEPSIPELKSRLSRPYLTADIPAFTPPVTPCCSRSHHSSIKPDISETDRSTNRPQASHSTIPRSGGLQPKILPIPAEPLLTRAQRHRLSTVSQDTTWSALYRGKLTSRSAQALDLHAQKSYKDEELRRKESRRERGKR